MRHRDCLLAAVVVCAMVPAAFALEVTANKSLDVDSSLGMKVDAQNAILTSAINADHVCMNKGMLFASNASVAGRDADGCIPVTGSGTSCAVSKFYDPTDASADGDGCVDAYVVSSAATDALAQMV